MIEKESRRSKKEKQRIEKGSRRLTLRRMKKFDPAMSECYICMFYTTLRNYKIKKCGYQKMLKTSLKKSLFEISCWQPRIIFLSQTSNLLATLKKVNKVLRKNFVLRRHNLNDVAVQIEQVLQVFCSNVRRVHHHPDRWSFKPQKRSQCR
jgi:hypothetical protein